MQLVQPISFASCFVAVGENLLHIDGGLDVLLKQVQPDNRIHDLLIYPCPSQGRSNSDQVRIRLFHRAPPTVNALAIHVLPRPTLHLEQVQGFVQWIIDGEVIVLLGRRCSERRRAVDAPTGYRNGYGKPAPCDAERDDQPAPDYSIFSTTGASPHSRSSLYRSRSSGTKAWTMTSPRSMRTHRPWL